MNWLKKLFTPTPTLTGRWQEHTYTKAEVFRKMKTWEAIARSADANGMHPVIIRHDAEEAIYWRDLLEEMQMLQTDSIVGRVWVTE